MPLPYLQKLRGVRVRQDGVDVANSGRVAGLDFVDSVVTYDASTGYVTIELGAAVGDLEFVALSGAANTLALVQARKLLRVSHVSATTLTVPANATVEFPVGTRILVEQDGAGQLTVAAALGVTIRTPETLKARAQYSTLELVKLATNEWLIFGDLEPANTPAKVHQNVIIGMGALDDDLDAAVARVTDSEAVFSAPPYPSSATLLVSGLVRMTLDGESTGDASLELSINNGSSWVAGQTYSFDYEPGAATTVWQPVQHNFSLSGATHAPLLRARVSPGTMQAGALLTGLLQVRAELVLAP